jgi:hypothetical protein
MTQKAVSSWEGVFARFAGKVAWSAGSPITFGVTLMARANGDGAQPAEIRA